jgi:hypothetical protein
MVISVEEASNKIQWSFMTKLSKPGREGNPLSLVKDTYKNL